jgi:hypothetical protein
MKHRLFARNVFWIVATLIFGGMNLRAETSAVDGRNARIDATQFAIFPWDEVEGTKEKYDELYDCGFNMAGFATPDALSTARDAHLKCWVTDPSIVVRGGEGISDTEVASRVKALAATTRSNPVVMGYRLVDEPRRDTFKQVSRWVSAFESEAPDKIPFVNLFPDYSEHKAGVLDDAYHTYMQAFVDEVKPRVLSFDNYGLFANGELRDTYFPNLETARDMSLKAGLPFYHVILGNTHFDYAEPSPQWFRFQVYSSLAYGVRGIAWFTYIDRERGNYRSAAIDLYGRRSPTWKMLRDVNLVCHHLAPTLVQMQSVGVFHFPALTNGCRSIADSKFLKDVQGNGPFVIGEFQNDTSRAVLIVNKNLTKSTHYKIIPKDESPGHKIAIQKVSAITGAVLPMSAENDWLAPGQGMLLLLGQADQPAK